MSEILKKLDSVFKMVSTIPVSGDSVEIMAAAKNSLREIYAEIKSLDESKNQTNKPEG